ncbi:UNVERIFIED_CONTAM: hypothetical protein GTU68_038849 [Idotea baltica]|nr:hypothetical protein [Idotea baltica]
MRCPRQRRRPSQISLTRLSQPAASTLWSLLSKQLAWSKLSRAKALSLSLLRPTTHLQRFQRRKFKSC